MGRPRNPSSRTDPAVLEIKRQYYYEHKNRILEAAKARYRVQVEKKEKEERERQEAVEKAKMEDEKKNLETWLCQLRNKLPNVTEQWLTTALNNQITMIEQQLNEKTNNQTDWETGI